MAALEMQAEAGMAWEHGDQPGWGRASPGGSQQLKEKSQGWEHSLDLTSPLGSEEQQTVFSATEASQ